MIGDSATPWQHLAPGCARVRIPGLDATAGLVVGTTGVLVIDTGSTLAEGAALRRAVRELTGRVPTHLVLTHGHFDHVFGAAAFTGARVYGQTGLESYLAAGRGELRRDAVEHGIDPLAAAEAARVLVRPGQLVAEEISLDLGGRTAHLVHPGRGHTDHDLVVLIPGTPAVVFCGDLVEESGQPQAGPDAVPHGWPAALDRVLALGGETAVYVPGHGAVVNASFIRAQRDELAARFRTP